MIKVRYIEENNIPIHSIFIIIYLIDYIHCEFVEVKKNWINGVTSLLLSWDNTPNTWFYNIYIVFIIIIIILMK